MSNHNALRPNITQETKDKLEKILLDELKGRDFVIVVLEHPHSWVATNATTPQEAKEILNKSLAKPWS